MGHQASKSRYNGTIDTVIGTSGMPKKAAKRANARHRRAARLQRAINRIIELGYAAYAPDSGTPPGARYRHTTMRAAAG